MKFAIFTASTPEWTPQQAVTEIAARGWDGVEWRVVDQQPPSGGSGFWQGNKCTWPVSSFLDDVDEIGRITGEAGLGMPSIGNYARCNQLDIVETVMKGAAALGVTQMRVPPRQPDENGYNAAFEASRRDYHQVQELSQQYGVKALVELHHQSLLSSCSAAARFCDGFDPAHVGVIHDIGNMVIEGYERLDWGLQILGDYLAHVHVKNAAPVAGEPQNVGTDAEFTPWTTPWAPMRTGIANLPALFEALRGIGYDGWVSVEDFSTEVELGERISDNLAFLKAISAAS